MRNLTPTAGFPLYLAGSGRLEFGFDVVYESSVHRPAVALMPVIEQGTTEGGPDPAYCMYRRIARPSDRSHFERHTLRYDLTVLSSGLFGKEYNKTIGHVHPSITPGCPGLSEIYQVVSGSAIWLIYRGDEDTCIEVTAVEAEGGDLFVVPPGYAHITINPADVPLIMANLVNDDIVPRYEAVTGTAGAPFRVIKSDAGGLNFIRNVKFRGTPALRRAKPRDFEESIALSSEPIYTSFTSHPENFKFLSDHSSTPKNFFKGWVR